ncbi:MAG: UDP-N-acetylmuramoyl-L-alanyl-D-glutamate--2,6-diaminopimelate ligase [Oscillospiraceae bacterium]|nr:UDP-N-acetylmuramoyl-L-alanyl-D-glutamate--2,6-diaminopimelate ligase [Oscillospiraceae bacterium]
MKLEKLLRELEYTLDAGGTQTEITSLVYDSRKVEPGSLFVCLTGFQTDGHDYIPAAVAAGAAALVVEREVAVPDGVTVVRVENSRYALALLAAAWFDHPARKLCVIGLTGTKGKTTTAHMIKAILEAAGHTVGMIGTVGAVVGDKLLKTRNTTPESYELHALFAKMVKEGCTHVVMEASSQGFKLHRTAGILFDVGVFLNLSPDHIGAGEHADFDEYLRCKSMLFSQCKQGLVNTDDDYWQAVTAKADCPLSSVSMTHRADYMADGITEERGAGFLGSRFTVKGRLEGQLMLNMPGRFNVENALAAIAAADMVGIELPAMAAGLAKVRVKGRTQVLETPAHYTMLIDYAHNAVSMKNLLQMLRSYNPGRLICVFGGGGNRARARRWDMGEISGKYADLTVLTMDNPRDEEVEAINEDIKIGLAKHDGKYVTITDRGDAIRWVMDTAVTGDIIALIGKGHEEYQEIKGVKHFFSEEQVVQKHLLGKM